MSAPDPLRIGQTPTPTPTCGTPAPGVWVVEIHGYDQESGELDTHSVSVHPTRAQAVVWVESVLEDVRSEYDEDFGWRPEVTEDHQQPMTPFQWYEGGPTIPVEDYENWVSEWTVVNASEGDDAMDPDPYLTLTVRQARFGYAYTAF